jgi:predicted dehydrogenase
VLHQTTRCEFTACCDRDSQKLTKTLRQYPHLRGYENAEELIDSDIDALVIATSISTHHELARKALQRGKHVLVEKPLADSSEKADDLVQEARRANRLLMTGHTFVFSPAIIKIKELLDTRALGDLHYISFSRVNLGLYQKDVDVVWDLAVHDISILLYWLDESPTEAFSFGRSCVQRDKHDVGFLWFQFASGCIASCEVSWLSPQKMRRVCVVGSERMVVYDDTEQSDKVRIYDRGVVVNPPTTFGEFHLTYRVGDIITPHLSNSEPLLNEVEHFLQCIECNSKPCTDGEFGASVVRAIELATSARWVPGGQLANAA